MSSFRSNLYYHFNDRRYAALFFIALGALVLSPILLPVMWLCVLARGWSALRLARANRWNKIAVFPLVA